MENYKTQMMKLMVDDVIKPKKKKKKNNNKNKNKNKNKNDDSSSEVEDDDSSSSSSSSDLEEAEQNSDKKKKKKKKKRNNAPIFWDKIFSDDTEDLKPFVDLDEEYKKEGRTNKLEFLPRSQTVSFKTAKLERFWTSLVFLFFDYLHGDDEILNSIHRVDGDWAKDVKKAFKTVFTSNDVSVDAAIQEIKKTCPKHNLTDNDIKQRFFQIYRQYEFDFYRFVNVYFVTHLHECALCVHWYYLL